MNENLPPPNWSPTGNSGAWHWVEQGETNLNTGGARACWKFYDDVHGKLITDKDLIKMKATKTSVLNKPMKQKSWLDKLKLWRK
jgi:hypothetical protein